MLSALYIVVLVAIAAALLAVAIFRAIGVKTKADYLVAGRSLPAFVLVLTLLTSWIGAGSLFAGAENAYKNGFAALWLPAGGWLGLVFIYFIAPRARKFAQFTLPDLLEARYNQAARVLGTIAILFAYVAITSYQFKGGGNVLHLIFPGTVTPELGTYIIAAFVIVTTALAGMSSVAYMDVAIGSLVTVICIIATPMLFLKAGGWAGLHAALPPTHFQVLGNLTLVGALEFTVPGLLLMLGNQVMYQKFFSAKSEKDARFSVVGWILGTLLLETLIVAIAVFGSALYQTGEVAAQPYEIIPYTARHGLPALMGALLLGAVFAKVISTASNTFFPRPAISLKTSSCATWRRARPTSACLSSRGSPWCCSASGRSTRPSTRPASLPRCSTPTRFTRPQLLQSFWPRSIPSAPPRGAQSPPLLPVRS